VDLIVQWAIREGGDLGCVGGVGGGGRGIIWKSAGGYNARVTKTTPR
jgi:hypothetical protein